MSFLQSLGPLDSLNGFLPSSTFKNSKYLERAKNGFHWYEAVNDQSFLGVLKRKRLAESVLEPFGKF